MKKVLLFLLCLTAFNRGFTHEVGDEIQSNTETYTLIKEMGEGAFGKVFEATDSTGEHVAIKCYKGRLETSNELFDLLNDVEREFRLGQALNHPNIVKSYDLFSGPVTEDNEQQYYLVLEFVSGDTVYKTKKRTVSFDESIAASEQLVDGLKYALDQGYLHLDLHLNNVMLSDDADIMIIDLASFFSWEELVEHANKDESKTTKSLYKVKTNVIREKKLNDFFAKHPKFLRALREHSPMKHKSMSQSGSLLEETKLMFHPYYFDRITEVAVSIIGKSTLEKEEKLALRAEIKMVAWSFREDSEDGLINTNSINEAIEELKGVFESVENQ